MNGKCCKSFYPRRLSLFAVLVPTLCVGTHSIRRSASWKIMGIGRRASGGLGYNAEHCNQIVE